ncbi:MAG: DinB family protein [Vicinamibacterales bacterium]
MVDTATLKLHFAYTAWASARIVRAAALLSDAERVRDFGTADKSVLGTLVHVYAADRVWLRRVTYESPAPFVDPDRDMHMSVLEHDWPALLERWQAFLDVTDPATDIDYQDLKGQSHRSPLWKIVLHVVNHGTHHRGQAAGFIRAMGHTPPPLDLIAYYRQL